MGGKKKKKAGLQKVLPRQNKTKKAIKKREQLFGFFSCNDGGFMI